ncbi:nucleolar protein dao-5-like isoform X2 [Ptychodera flava]
MKIEDDLDLAFQFLKNRVGRNWREFLRVLGASEPEIRNLWLIHFNVRGWHDCIYHGLLLWRQREKESASLEPLVEALRHISVMRPDIADELQNYWEELKEGRTLTTPSPTQSEILSIDLETVMSLRQQDLMKERERMLALLEGGRILKHRKGKAKRDFFGIVGSESSAFSRVEKQGTSKLLEEATECEQQQSPKHERNPSAKVEAWPKREWVADWVSGDRYPARKREGLNDIDKLDGPSSAGKSDLQPHVRKLDFSNDIDIDTPPARKIRKSEHQENQRQNPLQTGNDIVTASGQGTPSTKSFGQSSSKSSGFYGSNGMTTEPDTTPSNAVFSPVTPDDGYFTFPSSKDNVGDSTGSSTPAVPKILRDNDSIDDASYHTAYSSSPLTNPSTPRSNPKLPRGGPEYRDGPNTLELPPQDNRWSNSTTTNEDLQWEDFQNLSLKDYRLTRSFLTPKTNESSATSDRGTTSFDDMDWQHFDNMTPTYSSSKGIRHFTPIASKSTTSSVDSSKFNVIDESPENRTLDKEDQISEESGEYVTAEAFPLLEEANDIGPVETATSRDGVLNLDDENMQSGKGSEDSQTPVNINTNSETSPRSSNVHTPLTDPGQAVNPKEKLKAKFNKRPKKKVNNDIPKDDLVEPIDDYQDTDGAELEKPRRKRYTKKSPSKKNQNKKIKPPNKPAPSLKPKHGDKKALKERKPKPTTEETPATVPLAAEDKKPAEKRSSASMPESHDTSSPEVNRCIMCPLPNFRKPVVKPSVHKGYKPPGSPWELRRNGSSEEEISKILADANKPNGSIHDVNKSPRRKEPVTGEVKQFMDSFPRYHRSSRGSSGRAEENLDRYSPWEVRRDSETSRSGAHLVARSASLVNGSITPSFVDEVFESPWIEMDEVELERQKLLNEAGGLFDDLREKGLLDLQSNEVDDETCFLLLVGDAVRKLLEDNNQDAKSIYALKQLSESLCEVNLHKKAKSAKPGKPIGQRHRRRRRSDEEVLANVKHTLYGNYTLKFELKRNKKANKKQPNSLNLKEKIRPPKPPRVGKSSRDSPS